MPPQCVVASGRRRFLDWDWLHRPTRPPPPRHVCVRRPYAAAFRRKCRRYRDWPRQSEAVWRSGDPSPSVAVPYRRPCLADLDRLRLRVETPVPPAGSPRLPCAPPCGRACGRAPQCVPRLQGAPSRSPTALAWPRGESRRSRPSAWRWDRCRNRSLPAAPPCPRPMPLPKWFVLGQALGQAGSTKAQPRSVNVTTSWFAGNRLLGLEIFADGLVKGRKLQQPLHRTPGVLLIRGRSPAGSWLVR